MKVHLHQIPQGETLHLEGDEAADALGLEEAGSQAVSPLRYSLDVGVSEGGLFGTGSLSLHVRQQCVKCLGDFEHELVIEPFAFQIDLTGNELMDLTPTIREDIHLALPPHPRCDAVGSNKKCPAAYESVSRASRFAPENAGSAFDVLEKLKPISE